MSALKHALALLALRIVVLPLRLGEKYPDLDGWREFMSRMPEESEVRTWLPEGSDRGLYVVCGAISRLVVVDCDNDAAVNYWLELFPELFGATACVRTGKGWHFWFRLPEGYVLPSRAVHRDGLDYDIQAEKKGVVAPPSVLALTFSFPLIGHVRSRPVSSVISSMLASIVIAHRGGRTNAPIAHNDHTHRGQRGSSLLEVPEPGLGREQVSFRSCSAPPRRRAMNARSEPSLCRPRSRRRQCVPTATGALRWSG